MRMKTPLLLLVGALLGGNAVYYAATRGWLGLSTQPAPIVTACSELPRPASSDLPGQAGTVTDAPAPLPSVTQTAGVTPGAVPPADLTEPGMASPPPSSTGGQIASTGLGLPSGLLIPVQGVPASALVDTFTQARGQSRLHDAIDIMATEGTPVLATADGKVVKLFNSKAGGITLYQFDTSGQWVYYYAHLQRYADGVQEGMEVKRGQPIGYVGYTGNARPDGPHLHFAVSRLGADRNWWKATPVNPYPLLKGGAAR